MYAVSCTEDAKQNRARTWSRKGPNLNPPVRTELLLLASQPKDGDEFAHTEVATPLHSYRNAPTLISSVFCLRKRGTVGKGSEPHAHPLGASCLNLKLVWDIFCRSSRDNGGKKSSLPSHSLPPCLSRPFLFCSRERRITEL